MIILANSSLPLYVHIYIPSQILTSTRKTTARVTIIIMHHCMNKNRCTCVRFHCIERWPAHAVTTRDRFHCIERWPAHAVTTRDRFHCIKRWTAHADTLFCTDLSVPSWENTDIDPYRTVKPNSSLLWFWRSDSIFCGSSAWTGTDHTSHHTRLKPHFCGPLIEFKLLAVLKATVFPEWAWYVTEWDSVLRR